MADTDPDALAKRFLAGDHAAATAEAAGAIGDALREDANGGAWPRPNTWCEHQRAVLALAQLGGVDQHSLAESLINAVAWQRIDGWPSPLDPDVFDWMMRRAPDDVYDAVTDDRATGYRFLRSALFAYSDDRSRAWMVDWFRHEPHAAHSAHASMRGGGTRAMWSTDEWIRRVHLLCEADLPEAPIDVDRRLAPETSQAQVRLVCTYSKLPTDALLRSVAENLRAYGSDDPAGIWWDVEDAKEDLLLTLLEAGGPPGHRAAIVEAARAAGTIADDRAARLGAERPRPAWMDGDVAWEPEGVVEGGSVNLPDGRLSAADPYWAFEGVGFELQLPPGRYKVRVTVAAHPLGGRAPAVAELVVADVPAIRWERLGPEIDDGFGYGVEVGVGSFGAVRALTERFHDAAPEEMPVGARPVEVDAGERGSVVMFSVAPQHQICRTWAGIAEDGQIARVVSDLGLLYIDPERTPDDPLRPGVPPPEPKYVRGVMPGERATGIMRGERFVAADGRQVRVGRVYSSVESYLRVDAVWFHDDGEVGELLPADEFLRRFTRVDG